VPLSRACKVAFSWGKSRLRALPVGTSILFLPWGYARQTGF
jgi:hypothetical protein